MLRAEGLDATTVAGLLARLDARAEAGHPPLPANAVLLIDEAGMVDSGTLARVVDHADQAKAKLVLIGDPAQLGEIEAGGLFAAIARRSEPIHLDEVIRHRHELDREAAKLIREGRGSEAVDRYARHGRVVVAADHELRRQAIVADWSEAKRHGEDSLMIAKSNSEREHLNVRARELMRAEGQLGAEEVEVGGQRFAAGDEVITRVNDQRAQIYNRERWRVESVDVESGRMRLAGIDTNRQVGVDPGYLERVNPSDGAPALEYGYAATIYQAQGATLDSAYVLADPSMNQQDFYVAASRSRGETFFYATPEVSFDRVEIAPSPPDADALEHIARAAERDGSQAAAHDAALRERLGRLSTEELLAHRRELASEAGAERHGEADLERRQERLAEEDRRLVKLGRHREELGEEPSVFARAERAARRKHLARLEARERDLRETVADLEADIATLPAAEHSARAERAVAEHLIEERLGQRLGAVRVDPPDYLVKELGERPSDPARRQTWDRAVAAIEGYRAEHGIGDRGSTLGPRPEERLAQLEHQRVTKSLHRAQRSLGLERAPAPERTLNLGIER
ncbi:MAG TPA: AAA family ATPase [Solirubrobacterales bacterium]|nr:AAA family ATPase [Solirubrobacterales bacterium]